MHMPHWVALGGWLLGWILLWRVPRIPRSEARGAAGPLTTVVPARNEATRLPVLLEALTSGLAAEERLVVVDDHSTDGTPEVARRYPGVEVLGAPDLPEGWTGKAWACHNGALTAAPGELAFVDADVHITADALRSAVRQRKVVGGLLSIWPYHRVVRPYEHLSALFNVVCLMGLGVGSVIRPRRTREAVGPVIVTTTEDYRRVGGFASVRESIVEDLALGRRYADAGLPARVYGGGRDVAFRMYGEGFGALVQGWGKSIGGATVVMSPLRLAAIGTWLACSLGACVWVGGLPHTKSILFTALFAVQMGAMFRQVGNFGVLDALLYPVHVVFLIVVTALALFRTHVRRSVSWRGRAYGAANRGVPRS